MNHLRGSFVADSDATNKMIDSEIMDMILKAVPTAIKNVKGGDDYELDEVNPAAPNCPDTINHWDKCDKSFYETKGPGSAGCLGEGGERCECFTRNDNGWNFYSWFCHAVSVPANPPPPTLAFHA